MRSIGLVLFGFLVHAAHAQQNLAASAQVAASASSTGNFGPSNWTDGLKNATFFGWVGTATNFPQPAWMQLQWTQPQSLNRIRLFNPGTNFQPPVGNAVVFAGTAVLQYWDGNGWLNHDTITGQGSYGDSLTFDFPTIQTTRIRLTSFVLTGAANPGFDEWEVYNVLQDTLDAAVVDHLVENIFGGIGRTMRVRIRVRNVGNVPLVNPTVSWKVNTVPEIGPNTSTFPITLAPGADTLLLHPETTAAVQSLNGRELCMWVRATGDTRTNNDTLCVPLAGFGASVAALNGAEGLLLYPNPTTGPLHLKGLDTPATFELYDLPGRLCLRGEWPEEGLLLPVHWPAGSYFLLIETAKKRYGNLVLLQR